MYTVLFLQTFVLKRHPTLISLLTRNCRVHCSLKLMFLTHVLDLILFYNSCKYDNMVTYTRFNDGKIIFRSIKLFYCYLFVCRFNYIKLRRMSSVVQQDFVERFFKGAASGGIDDVRLFCKGEQGIQPYCTINSYFVILCF